MTDKLERQRLHFNSISKRYKEARESQSHLELKRLIWEYAFAGLHMPITRESRILEPMCGFAEGKTIISRAFGERFQYFGFDYSDSVVEDLKRTDPSANIEQADVTSYTSTELFDVVILIGGLHHVPDHASDVVASMAQLIKPAGYFINLEPTHGNPLFKYVRDRIYRSNSLFDEATERAFAVSELQSMFEQADLNKVHISYPGLMAYILYYNPDAFPALNQGSARWVQRLFSLERPLYKTTLARWFSFATLSIWQKPAIT